MKDFHPHIFIKGDKKWLVFSDLCKGCGMCLVNCPFGAIRFSKTLKGVYGTAAVEIDLTRCNLCGVCEIICPESAIKIEK